MGIVAFELIHAKPKLRLPKVDSRRATALACNPRQRDFGTVVSAQTHGMTIIPGATMEVKAVNAVPRNAIWIGRV